MANDSSRQSGHIPKGPTVSREDRPPGAVPMRHLTRLGSTTAPTSNPNGVGPVRATPTTKQPW